MNENEPELSKPLDGATPVIATFIAVALVVATVGVLTYVRLHGAVPASGVASAPRTESPSPSPAGKGTGPVIYLPTTVEISAPARSVVWAAVADQELFVSTDSGDNWSQRSLPAIQGGPAHISFVDDLHGWLLVGGTPETQCNSAGMTLWRTMDGAVTWSQLTPNGIAATQCKQLVYFFDSLHGYLSAWDDNHSPTVYATSDGGQSWRGAALPDNPLFSTAPGGFTLHVNWINTFGESTYLEASGSQDDASWHDRTFIYVSTDGGATWTWKQKLASAETVMVTESRWLMLTDPAARMESLNGGQQWHPFTSDYNPDSPALGGNQMVFGDSAVGYAGGRGSMQRTDDGGAHWARIETPGVFWPG